MWVLWFNDFMQIVPGILTDDVGELERRLGLVVEAKKKGFALEWVQIDFIDGVYADNITLVPTQVALSFFKEKGLKFEAHLMVGKANLEQWVIECRLVGFDRIMSQAEVTEDQKGFVSDLQNDAYEVGLSIDAQTSVSVLDRDVLERVDVIQVMTIQAGFSGQKMRPELLSKVSELLKIRNERNLQFEIEIDGGVKLEKVKMLKDIGADLVEVNSGLFGFMKTQEHESMKAKKQMQKIFEENLEKFNALIADKK
jgi:ribulose-phosphate 3-epimerase